MKVALVYDRVNKWGGAERVMLSLHEMFPKAPLYTSVYNLDTAPWAKVFPEVVTSFLQQLTFMRDKHELLAPLMPLAFESFDFSGYDLVISVTSESAKGVITKHPTKHICYCLTPTRYLWSHHKTYFKDAIFKSATEPIVCYLRNWDKIAAQRPDVMITVSSAVKKRISKYYNRDSVIIYPPVDMVLFGAKLTKDTTPHYNNVVKGEKIFEKAGNRSGFYLVVSRLVKYKKVDLVIKAFNKIGYPLVIVGGGKEEKKLKNLAKKNVKFVKNLTDKELAVYYQKARGLIFPQEEDFGLVAVEAQSAATPVIAYSKGGAQDIVIDGKTGIFFDKQDVESLISAIDRCEKTEFDRNVLFNNATKFSKERFEKEFFKLVKDVKR